jgi:predicted DNA-binding protein (UPF0251 family)
MRHLQELLMTLDEFEALRLADLEGLYQEQAAQQMNISRPTFSRIIDSAHRKIADAIVHGMALRIEGGVVRVEGDACCGLHQVSVSNEHEACHRAAGRPDVIGARTVEEK